MAEAGIATRAKSGVIGQEQVMLKIQELRRVLCANVQTIDDDMSPKENRMLLPAIHRLGSTRRPRS